MINLYYALIVVIMLESKMSNRSQRQIASIRTMYEWHLDMAARLEFIGRFNESVLHLNRAKLLEPAVKQSDAPSSAIEAETN